VSLPVVADSETVFLDEIRDVRLDPGDATRLPPEPGSPTRGSMEGKRVDVRIIAARDRDLDVPSSA